MNVLPTLMNQASQDVIVNWIFKIAFTYYKISVLLYIDSYSLMELKGNFRNNVWPTVPLISLSGTFTAFSPLLPLTQFPLRNQGGNGKLAANIFSLKAYPCFKDLLFHGTLKGWKVGSSDPGHSFISLDCTLSKLLNPPSSVSHLTNCNPGCYRA